MESTKNALWVPYKLHCLSCGKSLGSTVKMGDHLLDSFAWDKSTLALSNGFLLPNKKWAIYSQQLRKVLKEITEAQLTNRTQTPPLSPSKPTKYCKVIGMFIFKILSAVRKISHDDVHFPDHCCSCSLECLQASSGFPPSPIRSTVMNRSVGSSVVQHRGN